MLDFIKPTKLKLLLFLIIWVTVWFSIKLDKKIFSAGVHVAFPKLVNHIKETIASSPQCKDELKKIAEEINQSIDTDPKLEAKAVFIFCLHYLSQILLCYLCACIILYLMKDRVIKSSRP